jgi:hypothetical protein
MLRYHSLHQTPLHSLLACERHGARETCSQLGIKGKQRLKFLLVLRELVEQLTDAQIVWVLQTVLQCLLE